MSDLSLTFRPSTAEVMAAGSAEIMRLRADKEYDRREREAWRMRAQEVEKQNEQLRTAAHQLTLANELLRDALSQSRDHVAFWGGMQHEDTQAKHGLHGDLDAAAKVLAATAACQLCGATSQDGCRGLEQ